MPKLRELSRVRRTRLQIPRNKTLHVLHNRLKPERRIRSLSSAKASHKRRIGSLLPHTRHTRHFRTYRRPLLLSTKGFTKKTTNRRMNASLPRLLPPNVFFNRSSFILLNRKNVFLNRTSFILLNRQNVFFNRISTKLFFVQLLNRTSFQSYFLKFSDKPKLFSQVFRQYETSFSSHEEKF
jgi:hypothetical protein